ncbi:GNAT family N-acetyltransferase [Microbulbifer sp. A4B17]|uniref:GNAT family N-acetyltransferase n=1 Tax=Microbulbifer sp. A4B17 TaxID=359370 RepID=UPI000D52EDBA|nr:GNAT family N-acetyltransferase [Microbulbifer sp. A4B17]AWF81347.1 GNAT family N-acetyltransferase [Microbulbifer sp. A4B17]
MIKVERFSKINSSDVLQISLPPDQLRYVCTPKSFIADRCETTHLYLIKLEGVVIGYFKADLAYFKSYSFCPEDGLGMRAFAIDKSCQGRGLGVLSVQSIVEYLTKEYRYYSGVYLTVNCNNLKAIRCYKKCGFLDTGDLYFGGAAGPQHVMRISLQ